MRFTPKMYRAHSEKRKYQTAPGTRLKVDRKRQRERIEDRGRDLARKLKRKLESWRGIGGITRIQSPRTRVLLTQVYRTRIIREWRQS